MEVYRQSRLPSLSLLQKKTSLRIVAKVGAETEARVAWMAMAPTTTMRHPPLIDKGKLVLN